MASLASAADGAALAGLRVLDLSTGVAGPFGTKLLADFGAEVIKVEPPGGDPARRLAPFAADLPARESSLLFAHLNTNKRGLCLDVATTAGRRAIAALAAQADLLVDGPPAGGLAALGLDFATLRAGNPRLSRLSISEFGPGGPYARWRGVEMTLLALGGHMHSEGEPDREPLVYAGLKAQYLAGAYLAGAAMAALLAARAGARGREVELSLLECVLSAPDESTRLALWEYSRDDSRRSGYRRQGTYPVGVYPCADGYVYITGAILSQWPNIVAMLGMPELLHDPRFTDPVQRPHHHDDFEAIFWGWCADRTMLEVVQTAQAAHIPAAPVYAPHRVPEDPHFRARAALAGLPTLYGRFPSVGAPFRSAGMGWRSGAAPSLGAANRALLTGTLGLTALDRARLMANGGADLTPRPPSLRGKGVPGSDASDNPKASGLTGAPDPGTPFPRREGGRGVRSAPPLAGIRILDHGQVFAVPGAAVILAELGAEVIKVEPVSRFPTATRGTMRRPPAPALGYPEREPGERPWNRHYYNVLHLNKLSATFELKTDTGRALYKRLIAVTDIVIDNFATGVMARLGLGYATLREVRPDLIALSATGYGQDGPNHKYVAFGSAVDAISGHTYLRGYEGDDPLVRTGQTWPDSATAATIVFAVLAALHQRARTGEGRFIDLAEAEMFLAHGAEALLDWTANRRSRTAIGNTHASFAPHNCYPGAGEEEWITLAVTNDREWAALRAALGEPAWAAAPALRTALGRRRRRAELDAGLAAATCARDAASLMADLQKRGVAAGRVLRPSQILEDPHLNARGFLVPVAHAETGTRRYPTGPWRWEGARLPVRRPPPDLGAHNDYIYGELLGLSAAEVATLEAEGLIGTAYPE
jgi:crotonobetainyl-CoA:carnitine CoA-transferase CaiB-like acyl-CoA transferase